MPDTTLGPVTAWEYPDNPPSQSDNGDNATLWVDESDTTFTSDINEHHVDYNGEERLPTGFSAAPLLALPLDSETAGGIQKVYATWTAWYSGQMPTHGDGKVFVIPVVAKGLDEVYGHNLKPRSMYSWDTDSLLLTETPQTFTRELLPDGGNGAYNFKTVEEILTNDNVYAPAESLRDDEFFVQMRVTRTLTDVWTVVEGSNVNTGSQITVHVSEVTVHLGEPGPAPVVTTPTDVTMKVDWEIQPEALRSEVRIGDPITVQGEEPIEVLNMDGGTFTFTGLAPVTTYSVGVRSITSTGPSAWVEVEDQTLAEGGDPGGPDPEPGARPHYHRSIRDGAGNLKTYSEVEILEPGTETPIEVPVYASAEGSTLKGATFPADDGIVDFYLAEAAIVDIRVTGPDGQPPKRFVNQWVGDPNGGSGGGGGGGAVDSVNGQVGEVELTAADVGALAGVGVSRVQVIGEYAYNNIEPAADTLYIVMMEVG